MAGLFDMFSNGGAGFMPTLRNNSDMLLQTGLGLLSGRTANEQAAMGLKGFSDARKQNMTLKALEKYDPELAQLAASGGIPMGDALKFAYQKRLQANDPGTQLDLQLKQAQIDKLRREPKGSGLMSVGGSLYDPESGQWMTPPNKEQGSEVDVRRNAAAQYGLTPEDPRYQSYVLTGKMPREDAQPLTATDKKAILDADEMVQVNRDAITALDQASQINDKANSGYFASTRATLGNNLPDYLVPDMVSSPESSQATAEYDNLIQGQALGQLKAIFGGAPTEGERAILLELQASSSKPPEVRAQIISRARALAEKRLQFNADRAGQLRGGTYYKPQGGNNSATGNRTSSGVNWSVEP